jgi:hypothetical protein
VDDVLTLKLVRRLTRDNKFVILYKSQTSCVTDEDILERPCVQMLRVKSSNDMKRAELNIKTLTLTLTYAPCQN